MTPRESAEQIDRVHQALEPYLLPIAKGDYTAAVAAIYAAALEDRQQARDAGFAEANAWRGIDSAPWDGTLILAVWRDYGSLVYALARYRPESKTWWDGAAACDKQPVLWMPLPALPAPPALSAEANEGRCDG